MPALGPRLFRLGALSALAACAPARPDVASTDTSHDASSSGNVESTSASSSPATSSSDVSSSSDPYACESDLRCPCGQIGCGCPREGECQEGTCDADTRTCTLVQDDMVFVPAGGFTMGCIAGRDTDELTPPCDIEELPVREVTLDAYFIDRFEVTKGEYRKCLDAEVCRRPYLWDDEFRDGITGKWRPGLDTMPAASVSWIDAKAYCEWAGKRLPTETEWERAARGHDGRKYPWGNTEPTCDHANHRPWDIEKVAWAPPCPFSSIDGYGSLTPVGYFPKGKSAFGAFDMAGNVKEWINDGFEFGIGYGDLPTHNPKGVESETGRVFRGGSWQAPNLGGRGYALRCSQRGFGGISATNLALSHGFRCARDAPSVNPLQLPAAVE